MKKSNKKIWIIVLIIILCLVCLCLLLVRNMNGDKDNTEQKTISKDKSDEDTDENDNEESDDEKPQKITYEDKLFDNSYVHEISITISDEDYSDLTTRALDKNKYNANVVIDGDSFENVVISSKGVNSLQSTALLGNTNSYSLKLRFENSSKDGSYYGLEAVSINNNVSDKSQMRNHIAYDMFNSIGVPAPLTSYTHVTLNGEGLGLYLAIENLDQAFLERNGAEDAELYKPEAAWIVEMMSKNGDKIQEAIDNGTLDEYRENYQKKKSSSSSKTSSSTGESQDASSSESSQTSSNTSGTNSSTGDGSGTASDNSQTTSASGQTNSQKSKYENHGSDLKYTDEEEESYCDIFDNSIKKCSDKDKKKVIAALKNLSEQKVEKAIDTEEVINYFAGNTFTVNYDTYTGYFMHNYYLMENDGILSMLPWDYDLTLSTTGTFTKSKAEEDVYNSGIDELLGRKSAEELPMWNWIAANEAWLNKYHDAVDRLITDYFESGKCEAEISRVDAMIRSYVDIDDTGICTIEEYEEGVAGLRTFCEKRAKCIRSQLDEIMKQSDTDDNN